MVKSALAGEAPDNDATSETSAFVDLLPTGVFALDASGSVLYVNRWMRQFLGVQQGQAFSSVFPVAQRARIDDWRKQLARSDETTSSTLLLPLPNSELGADLVLEATTGVVAGRRVVVGLLLLQTNPLVRQTLGHLLDSLRRTLTVVETLLGHEAAPPERAPWQRQNRDPKQIASLSPREREVLKRCLEGASVQSISDEFAISVFTVRNHLKSIYRKLHVKSRAELMRRYVTA